MFFFTVIAPSGHISWQHRHLTHFLLSMTGRGFISMAETGHTAYFFAHHGLPCMYPSADKSESSAMPSF
jgi:hypothetical protein